MFKINFGQIVTQSITALVVAVFIGACAIVWNGATTVDTKVQQTKEDMQFLINSLSEKLASYEVQLSTQSNQLVTIINNQKTIIKNNTSSSDNIPKVSIPNNTEYKDQLMQQKAYSSDIMRQLKR